MRLFYVMHKEYEQDMVLEGDYVIRKNSAPRSYLSCETETMCIGT